MDVELDERAGQLLFLPGRGLFAGAQPNDRVLPANRLAGPERDVLDDAVALVEDPEHRHALRHRRDPALPGGRHRHLLVGRSRGILLLGPLAAGGERERDQQRRGEAPHFYSGIQGS
jgi:hypothetical protein